MSPFTPHGPALTPEQVWRAVEKASYAVVCHLTPRGEPRSTGVLYHAQNRRLYVVVGKDSFKARHIAADGRVSVTVSVRKGGVLAAFAPIPPATVSFAGTATVHPPTTPALTDVVTAMGRLLPPAQQGDLALLEIVPHGTFLTYGVGVSLMTMRRPEAAWARTPVG